jgi:hypothetical protein
MCLTACFIGLNTDDFYYWRVDVVSGGKTYIGRQAMFRLAHLAFPGAEGYGYVHHKFASDRVGMNTDVFQSVCSRWQRWQSRQSDVPGGWY